MDAIDGAVARVTKSASNLGAFLDGVVDRYVEFLLLFGLAIYLWGTSYILPSPIWIIILVFGTLMPSFVTAYANHRCVVTEPHAHQEMAGLMERFERLVIIYIGMLAGHLYHVKWLLASIVALAALTNLTAIQRIHYVVTYKKPAD